MMVSSKGRYALRVMLDMAEQGEVGNIRLKDIAKRQDISVKYLESIMTTLCKGELVKSTLGKDGGYRLVRPPSEYTVGELDADTLFYFESRGISKAAAKQIMARSAIYRICPPA